MRYRDDYKSNTSNVCGDYAADMLSAAKIPNCKLSDVVALF
jgi:hypothetical protein